MAAIVMLVIIFLSLVFGAELGPKADPTTTSYAPRPDWYFFFLFGVLRVMKNVPKFTPWPRDGAAPARSRFDPATRIGRALARSGLGC